MRRFFKPVLWIGIAALVVALLWRFVIPWTSGASKITVTSLLKDSVDIEELSTAEFRYKGIAEHYKDEQKKNADCRIAYSAIVKAYFDLNGEWYRVDDTARTITAKVPPLQLKVILETGEPFPVLPADANISMEEKLTCCREDAEREARESKELADTAAEGFKTTVEGLLYPLTESRGYRLVWE